MLTGIWKIWKIRISKQLVSWFLKHCPPQTPLGGRPASGHNTALHRTVAEHMEQWVCWFTEGNTEIEQEPATLLPSRGSWLGRNGSA
jgi:hypothetical protein